MGNTVVRGMNIRFVLELNAYEATVFIETYGVIPQESTKHVIFAVSWLDVATQVSALLTAQAAVKGSTVH